MAGEWVIRKGGCLGLEDDDNADEKGAGQVFTDKPEECCCCDPCESADPKPHKLLHSWTSHSSYPAEDLTPYKKKGECFKYWVMFEGSYSFNGNGCLSSKGTTYGSGSVNNGELVGLPDSFKSNYSYDGAMKIALYCC
jgi:hypothetical protein